MSNMMEAMQQLQLMQQKMEEAQASLDGKFVTEETGGGMVRCTVDGNLKVTRLEIKPEAITPDDKEMLEDLIIAAVNKGIESAKAMAADEMQRATAGLMPNIPGLPF